MKLLVTSAPCLALVDLADLDIALTVSKDASKIAAGVSVLVDRDGSYYPVAYYSRKFNDTEKRYSITDREVLAIVDCLRHFKHMLLDWTFKQFTDHKPLTTCFIKTGSLLQEKLGNNRNYVSSSLVYSCNMLLELKMYLQMPYIVAPTMRQLRFLWCKVQEWNIWLLIYLWMTT